MGKRGKLPANNLPVATAMPTNEYKPSKEAMERERRDRAEEALRTFERAEKYKRDKGLMGDVKMLAKEKMASLSKIK